MWFLTAIIWWVHGYCDLLWERDAPSWDLIPGLLVSACLLSGIGHCSIIWHYFSGGTVLVGSLFLQDKKLRKSDLHATDNACISIQSRLLLTFAARENHGKTN